ncbi:rho GTPase-activating protein 11A isoform X1 [Conger conger]|uniref:rho GTPase-activating protein 11A isoform X1 n=1 Tax=Conger conger TaxID=82655 RepID=UPI002A59CB24|nr:rho GTPase-activating protein 11A isoform X1 [Conger conger]
MKISDRNVMRLAVVQHIRATYGIKIKNWNKSKASNKLTASHSGKVFGVPLDTLQQCSVAENGNIPCFLVDTCTSLMEHVHTEGLFRKSGSVVRLKSLKAKLDQGEECIPTALPCDVAGLLKQFFRELPDPVLPPELHEALLKAQQLPTAEERTSATLLLSCMLPDKNLHTLSYFFTFLQNVSQRCAYNKMDSSNLSVIFAPNLLHSGDGTEKMNSSTEKRLKLQAAVVHCFIENAQAFGVVPQFIAEKVPAMLGCESGLVSPFPDATEDGEQDSGVKKRRRRSVGDMVNGALNKLKSSRTPTNTPQTDTSGFSSATPVIMTPNTKRKLGPESSHSMGFSNKKRRSIKKNLGLELLPNVLFGSNSTPSSVLHESSPSVSLDSHNALSSMGMTGRHTASSARRKSRRISGKHINRIESGKAGCFSPKVSKKEAARKSLRLRFSLGKSTRDPSVISNSLPAPKGSETIGWRLATQESATSFRFTTETAFIPAVLPVKSSSKSSKFISKSEDNLLTPQCDPTEHRTSWIGASPVGPQNFDAVSYSDTPMGTCLNNNYFSEPVLVPGKPLVIASMPKRFCCVYSAESLEGDGSFTESDRVTGPTLLKIKRAFTESGSDLRSIIEDHGAPSGEVGQLKPGSTTCGSVQPESSAGRSASGEGKPNVYTPNLKKSVVDDQNVTFDQIEILPLSPLHIDSLLFETDPLDCPLEIEGSGSFQCAGGNDDSVNDCETERVNCSRLIEALDISPLVSKPGPSSEVQSTPYRNAVLVQELETPITAPAASEVPAVEESQSMKEPDPKPRVQNPGNSADATETVRLRVADHVQRFNRLTLNSPKLRGCRSPIKYQRTPVRQSVRRINSLLGDKRATRPDKCTTAVGSPLVKSVSCDSGLFKGAGLKLHQAEDQVCISHAPSSRRNSSRVPPPVPPKKRTSIRSQGKHSALGDVTNKVQQKVKGDLPLPNKNGTTVPSENPGISVLRDIAEKEKCRYKGSPKNPLPEGRLRSATKPIDL